MKVEFVSDKKLDAMLETEFPEYADDSPQAVRWDELADELKKVLGKFAEDQEDSDAGGDPGFLSSDIFQGYECLNAEFNAASLLAPAALKAVTEFFDRSAPDYSFDFHFFGDHGSGSLESMHCGIYRAGTLYLPKHKAAKTSLRNAGWAI